MFTARTGHHHLHDPRFARPGHDRIAVVVEAVVRQARADIDQFHIRAILFPRPGAAYASRMEASLPIDALLPEIRGSLARHTRLLVEAPPGAGKTTRVPV